MLMLISLLILCKLSIMEGRTLWAQRWVQTRGDYTLHNSEKPVPLSAYLCTNTCCNTPFGPGVSTCTNTTFAPGVATPLPTKCCNSVVTLLREHCLQATHFQCNKWRPISGCTRCYVPTLRPPRATDTTAVAHTTDLRLVKKL